MTQEHLLKRLFDLVWGLPKITSILTTVQMKDVPGLRGGERTLEFQDGTKIHIEHAKLEVDKEWQAFPHALKCNVYFKDDPQAYPFQVMQPHGIYAPSPNDGPWTVAAYEKLEAFIDRMLLLQETEYCEPKVIEV